MTKNTALKIQAICTLIVVLVLGGTIGWFIWRGSDMQKGFEGKMWEKGEDGGFFFDLGEMNFGDFDPKHLVMEEGIRIPAEGIRDLEFEWPAGQVDIQKATGPDLILREGARGALEEKHKLVWTLENGRLKIRSFDPVLMKKGAMGRNHPAKQLILEVPEDLAKRWNSLLGNAASADIHVDAMKANTLQVKSVSGDIHLEGVEAEKASVETVSGDVNFQRVQGVDCRVSTVSGDMNVRDLQSRDLALSSMSGDIKSKEAKTSNLTASTTSGDVDWKGEIDTFQISGVSSEVEMEITGKRPQKCRIETVSGDIHLTLPGSEPWTISRKKTVGDFESNIPILEQANADVVFQTVSGGIKITGK